MRSTALLAIALLAPALLAGCTTDENGLPDGESPGLFERAAGVDVVVTNEGLTPRNVTVDVAGPSGDVVQSGSLDVPPDAERGLQATLREPGNVRVVVTAEDYGGGKAEGDGNPWECPGGARLTFVFVLAADPTDEPAFQEARCGA